MSEKMTNRKLTALETKRKLLETAKRIIREKGLVNTSIEEITKACGVANGTFYTYFKRKEDVVFALSHDMFREIYEEAQNYDSNNIIILCPNHHRLIHKIRPDFDPEKLTFSVKGKDILHVVLDYHLRQN